MPTPTDLVTDLPADFEVFGQAVDSSMADLKGGTTGQILSKNSNTDMDFIWIANDQGDITGVTATSPLTGGGTSGAITVGIQAASTSQSGAVQLENSTSSTSTTTAAVPASVKSAYDLATTANTSAGTAQTTANAAIPKSTLTAKGSIVAATASSTPANVSVGANDLILTADSSQSTGLTYTGGWTTWTPTLTGMTLGNGTIIARYQKIGKIVNAYFSFILGSTSAISSFPRFSLPIAPSQSYLVFPSWYKDEGVADYTGTILITSGDAFPRVGVASGTYVSDSAISSTVPFTWGSTDRFFCELSYEVA